MGYSSGVCGSLPEPVNLCACTNSIVRDIRLDIFQNLQRLGMSFYDQTTLGSIVSQVIMIPRAVADMFSTVFQAWFSSFLLSSHPGNHVSLDWHLTIWIPALSSHYLVFLPVSITKLSNRLRSRWPPKNYQISMWGIRSIEGMRIVRALSSEKSAWRMNFRQINGEHLDYASRSVDVNSLFL